MCPKREDTMVAVKSGAAPLKRYYVRAFVNKAIIICNYADEKRIMGARERAREGAERGSHFKLGECKRDVTNGRGYRPSGVTRGLR